MLLMSITTTNRGKRWHYIKKQQRLHQAESVVVLDKVVEVEDVKSVCLL
jgi:hypothetical protein